MRQKLFLNLEIDDERIYRLLVSALEGGSNYWYMIEDVIWPTAVTFKDHIWDDERKKNPDYVNQIEVPFCEGGALIISDRSGEGDKNARYRLDRAAIEKGLNIMANLKEGEGGHHFPNFMKGDDDAETGDVFLQCCVFGKIIYG